MIYIIEFIFSFICGFALGLFNRNLIKAIISGSMMLPKGNYSYVTASGWEKLGGFRSRFVSITLLIFSVAVVGFFLYDSILKQPFVSNFSDVSFYFKIIILIFGIYYGAKISSKGTTTRELLNIKDEDVK